MGQEGEQMEVPTLGRPFQLGMFYDCRSDLLISGPSVCDKTAMNNIDSRKSEAVQTLNIIRGDSLDKKLTALELERNVRLHVVSGLLEPSITCGAWLADRIAFATQIRTTLHYRQFTHMENIKTKELKKLLAKKSEELQKFADTATHVVVAVAYGVDAFTNFTVTCKPDDDISVEETNLATFTRLMKRTIDKDLEEDEISQTLEEMNWGPALDVTYYGDINRARIGTPEACVSLYKNLPLLLKVNGGELPILAWLYPLDKLVSDQPAVFRPTKDELNKQILEVMENLDTAMFRAKKILLSGVCSKLNAVTGIDDFILILAEYISDFKGKLKDVLPKIHEGSLNDQVLQDMLQDHDMSQFSKNVLDEWLDEKHEEECILKRKFSPFLQLKFCQNDSELMKIHENTAYVLCLMLSLESRAKPSDRNFEREIDVPSSSEMWFDDDAVLELLNVELKRFADLMTSYAGLHDYKFVIGQTDTTTNKVKNIPSKIWVRTKDGLTPFDTVIRVDQLAAGQIRKTTVKLDWNLPADTGLVKHLKCSWRESREGSNNWQNTVIHKSKKTHTVAGLLASHEYDFKVICVDIFDRHVDSNILMALQTSGGCLCW